MAEAKVKRVINAEEQRFKLAQYDRNEYVLNVPQGVEIEDCTQPEFWAHIANKLRPYDHIEVRAEDGSWVAELLVLGCDRNWAKVHVMSKTDLVNMKLAFVNDAAIVPEWSGPQTKWRVKRVSDNEILQAGLSTKDESIAWIRNYEDKVLG